VAVFICLFVRAQNITSPQVGCVDVSPNGNIVVNWQVPPDPNLQFQSYNIYASTTLSNPSYTLQASVTAYNTNVYTCTNITNANTQAYFMYVQTITTASLTLPPLDTVRTLYLSPLINGPVAQLHWQNITTPMPTGEGSWYEIWKEYPVGNWYILDSVPVNPNFTGNYNYNDTISVCNDTLSYRIELYDNVLHCTSISNVRGGWFQDKNKPSAPYIDSVSVVNNVTPQYAIMGISPAYSKDVECFLIYDYDNTSSTYIRLDSICNYNHNALYSAATTTLDPTHGSITLSTISQDSCAKEHSVFPGNDQSTIYLSFQPDFCKKQNVIKWTAYTNMVTGVKNYDVYCSINLGPFVCIGDTTATTFFHRGLSSTPGINYCYYVRAHSNGKTVAGKDSSSSTSNKYCYTVVGAQKPTLAYLSNVSVNPQQTIDISWYVKPTDPIGGFNLYKSSIRSGGYSLVQSFSFTRGTANYLYTDAGVNTNTTEYFYYVSVLDSACLLPVMNTDTSNSILLKAIPTPNLTATLNWNAYSKYSGNVSAYNIYRSVDGVFSAAPIGTVSGGTYTYVDDLSPYANLEGMFVYYVAAVEGSGDFYGFTETSTSNYDTVYIDANLYIPNAFVTYGVNKIFLPIGAFVDNADYILDIYDRWGAKIYETTDVNKGWDGTGHPEGVYAYTVQYKTSLGEYRQRKGTVTLIR
jgi:hypothetical protein